MPPSQLRRRLRRGVALVLAAAFALVGCAPPTATEVGPDTGEEIPSVTAALPGSVSSLYVGHEAGILNYHLAAISQEGLTMLDTNGDVQPALAESWEQPDDTTYVFALRDGAKFQDGSDVTVEDVVFSLETARDPELSPGLSYYLTGVDRISAIGDDRIEITLNAPDAAFLKNMSSGGAGFITSKRFWQEHDGKIGNSRSLVLGTGPYRVTEFVPDSHVSYERVDTWWGGVPKVEHLTVKFIPDESTRLLAARSGEIDIAFSVPVQQSRSWQQVPDMRIENAPDLSYVGLYFNTTVKPFDDPKVREAFAHSFDRRAVAENLLRNQGEAAGTIMTPESLATVYDADQAREKLAEVPQREFDLDKAKAALSASSQPNGFETEMLVPATGPHLKQAALAYAENLATIGVKLKVREVPIEEWLAAADVSAGYGVSYMWYFSTLGQPEEISSFMLGAGNVSGYENPEIQELLAQALAETDTEKRIELLLKVEKLQAADIIDVPLWWGQSITAVKMDLGIRDLSPYRFVSCWPAALYRAAT